MRIQSPARAALLLARLGKVPLPVGLILGGLLLGPAAPLRPAELLVADQENAAGRRYDATTGAYLGDLVPPGSGGSPNILGMTFGPDGNLYVSNYENDQVLRYRGTDGAFLGVPLGKRFQPIQDTQAFSTCP